MQAQLTVARGSSAGKAFTIDGAQFIIGRATGCHLRPQSDAISRQHCAFIVKQEHLYVKDLGSRNGTHLNEEKISGATEVKTGDLVRIGPLLLRVDLGQSEDATRISNDTVDVIDATAEASAGAMEDESVIGDWLEDADEDRGAQEKATREFDLDATITTTVIRTEEEEEKNAEKKKKKKKKEFGKLPSKTSHVDATENSCDAAADTLRELYNRGM